MHVHEQAYLQLGSSSQRFVNGYLEKAMVMRVRARVACCAAVVLPPLACAACFLMFLLLARLRHAPAPCAPLTPHLAPPHPLSSPCPAPLTPPPAPPPRPQSLTMLEGLPPLEELKAYNACGAAADEEGRGGYGGGGAGAGDGSDLSALVAALPAGLAAPRTTFLPGDLVAIVKGG